MFHHLGLGWLTGLEARAVTRRPKTTLLSTTTEALEIRTVLSATRGIASLLDSAEPLADRKAPKHVDTNDHIQIATSVGVFVGETLTFDGALIGKKLKSKKGMDVNVYAVTVSAGQTLNIDVDARGTRELDSFLQVFDGHGNLLSSNDNGLASGESPGKCSYLQQTFALAGTYYISISGARNLAADILTGLGDRKSFMGEYRLNLSCPQDLSEFDGTYSVGLEGSVTAFGQTVSVPHTSFPLNQIQITINNGSVTTNLPGNPLVNFYEDGSIRFDAAVTVQGKPVTVRFEGHISHRGGEVVGSGTWSIVSTKGITGSGTWGIPDATPTDTDGTLANAVVIPNLSTPYVVNGTIDPQCDVDLYAFQATQGELIHVDIDLPNGSSLNPYLRIFNSAGEEIDRNNDANGPEESGATFESYIAFTAPVTGTYYIGVSAHENDAYDPLTGEDTTESSAGTGAYSLTVCRNNESEPNELDGDYEGSYVGKIKVLLVTLRIPQHLPLNTLIGSVNNGIFGLALPGLGLCAIDELGNVNFGLELTVLNLGVELRFSGKFTVNSQGHGIGSGTWGVAANLLGVSGSGTWSMDRDD